MSDFRRAAIPWIRQNAKELEDLENYGAVWMAAHLFAIASKLHVDRGDLVGKKPNAALSLADAAARLARLPDDHGTPALFLDLLDALLTVEESLVRQRDLLAVPPTVELIPRIGRHLLGGLVHQWLRPKSLLSQVRSNRYQEAGAGRPPAPSVHPSQFLGELSFFWQTGQDLPLVLPRLDPVLPLIAESGRDAAGGDGFRIALCPLPGDFHPLFEVTASGKHFQARRPEGMKNLRTLCEHLLRLLDVAEKERVQLLVLPELMVSQEAREHLAQAMKERLSRMPYGVVAGSFHIWGEPPATESAPALPRNESQLLDNLGRALLTHHKKKGFRIPRHAVRRPFFPDGYPELGDSERDREIVDVYEGIEEGMQLTCLDTSLGRIALLICADLILAHPEGYVPLVERLRPDLLVVISMSPETAPFERFFEILSEHWIATLFVNADCLATRERGVLLAFCDLALYEAQKQPPTRYRWVTGGCAAELIYHQPPDGKTGWRACREEDAGAKLHPLLGLVVDLGLHCRPERESEEKLSS